MNQVNYQKELEKILDNEKAGNVPSLFLHSCCAPCSSYVLEYLCPHFHITVFYYNPNISASYEYEKRVAEQIRLITAYNEEKKGYPIQIVKGDYDPSLFYNAVKGYEHLGEGSERCFHCFEQRLSVTAKEAAKANYDYFGTTLTISPLKNAGKINEIGYLQQEQYGVKWIPSDFKKKNGYQRSIALSKEYDLYRQNYCGCSFSKAEREETGVK